MSDALALPFLIGTGVNNGGYNLVSAFTLGPSESKVTTSISYDIGCIIGGASSYGALICPVYFIYNNGTVYCPIHNSAQSYSMCTVSTSSIITSTSASSITFLLFKASN